MNLWRGLMLKNIKKSNLLTSFVILCALIAAPLVLALVYDGGHAPNTIRNNSDNSIFNVLLHGFADSRDMNGIDTCTDSDNGVFPNIGGTMSFTDFNVNYSNLQDYCEGPILHEFACSKDYKVQDSNGGFNQINGYASVLDVNCAALVGYTTCSADLNGTPVIARCV